MLRGGQRYSLVMRCVLAAACVIALGPPVQAFYWAGWPGSNIVVPPVQSEQFSRMTPPSVIPPQLFVNNWESGDPKEPPVVPEPATCVIVGLGLAGLAAARLRRKRRFA